jgi:hypothetical protein
MFPIGDGSEWLPFLRQQSWEPYMNSARAWAIDNENRRELENLMLSEQLAEKKHQQEMMKMVLDTNRAIRKMHEETRMDAFKTQSQIANQWTKALAGGGGG